MKNKIYCIFSFLDRSLFKLKHKFAVASFGETLRPFALQLIGKENLIGVEIGTYKGEHANTLVSKLHIKKLYCVDPWEDYAEYTDHYGKKQELNKVYLYVCSRFKKVKNIQICKGYSTDANIFNAIPENLDFIYVDGNHRYEFVKLDIETYWSKLRTGGILAGHDIDNGYCDEHNGVIQAVMEFAIKNKLVLRIFHPDWWIVKGV